MRLYIVGEEGRGGAWGPGSVSRGGLKSVPGVPQGSVSFRVRKASCSLQTGERAGKKKCQTGPDVLQKL